MKSVKTYYLYLIICIFYIMPSKQVRAQTLQWVKQTGSTGWDKGIAVATDSMGNVYSTGNFAGTADFDPGPGVFNLTFSGGHQDVYISKLDPSGNFIWAKQIAGAGWEEVNAITVDDHGDIYLTGSFLGITDFDPSPAVSNLITGGDIHAFICKLDSSGSLIWAKQIGGTLAVNAYAIAVDDNGNVFTTGYFDGIADFDPDSAMTYNFTVKGYSDIFISKLDAVGNFIWAKQLGGSIGEVGHSIAIDDSGNIYSTGTFSGTVDFDPGAGIFQLSSSPGKQNIYVSKLDASGSFVWSKKLVGETGYTLITDKSNNIYVSGYDGWNDIHIHKLNPSGNMIWSKQIGAFVCYSLALDDYGNIYATGSFYNTGDFDPSVASFTMTAKGSSDAYISKLDSAGNFIWAKQLGGTDEVISRAIALSNNGNIYTTGEFNGTGDFDPAAANYPLTAISSYDIYIHKLANNPLTVEEKNFIKDFTVYPNPTQGNFSIDFKEKRKKLYIVLRNITGQVVDAFSIENSDYAEMKIEEASGVYVVEITDADHAKTTVLITKH